MAAVDEAKKLVTELEDLQYESVMTDPVPPNTFIDPPEFYRLMTFINQAEKKLWAIIQGTALTEKQIRERLNAIRLQVIPLIQDMGKVKQIGSHGKRLINSSETTPRSQDA